MAKRIMNIKFPLAGQDRKVAYRQQPPFTTPSCNNARPTAIYESRRRGGQRPSLMPDFQSTLLGSGNPIRMMANLTYISNSLTQVYASVLCASSNGIFYHEDPADGVPKTAVYNATLASDRCFYVAEHRQKLYIADKGDALKEGDSATATCTAGKISLHVVDIGNGVNIHDHMVHISNSTGDFSNGTYKITAVHQGVPDILTLDCNCNSSGTCSYRTERGPKVYDPVANTLVLMTAAEGFTPVGNPFICTYRDRLVLAGYPLHQWYMSRQGQDTVDDWDYGAEHEDVGRAISGANADASKIGDRQTALIPTGDDYLLFGCENSLWVLKGDPAFGGELDNISRKVGIIGPKAWCRGPNGETIILSHDGLYGIGPGPNMFPESISRERLPEELRNIGTQYEVSLGYDMINRGVQIVLKGL